MTEETQVTELQVETEVVDYKALYEKAQKDIEKIAAKKDELLNETKKAKADREAAEAAIQKAAEEKAQKDGEFEKLWKTAKQEKEDLENRLKNYAADNRREKVNVTSMRLATELADGDNAELLSEFITRNLDKIANEHGEIESSVLEAVKSEFKNNNKYKSLLRGSQAQGGGATGNMSGSQVGSKTVDRASFDKYDAVKKSHFISSGGQVVDNI